MLGPDFRHGKEWISEKLFSHFVSTCLNLILWKYDVWTLRNGTVIRDNPFLHPTPKFRKPEIFRKYWSWWGVWPQKLMKFLRWREFHCFAAPRFVFKCLVEWLHRREIASAGAIVHTMAVVQSVVFRFWDRIFATEKNEYRKSFVAK